MSNEILNIEDVFQIEGRGTVVTGIRGSGWDLAKAGDPVELRLPGGSSIRTSIKDMEVFRKGVLSGPPFPGGVLLADKMAADQLPRGTQMLSVQSF
jgi:translation elongation factor EF-Tu-like GTPase